LRNKQVDGIRFLRQYSVCNYILDFYCPKLRLGIELDGSQHNDEGGRSRDERRNMYLSSLDIKIVRFWNNDIWNNIEQVMEKIYQEIDNNPT
jgi:very-short-patch-repair endonuclease